MSKRARAILIVAAVVTFIGCDQSTKLVAGKFLSSEPTLSLFGDFVRLEYIRNPGAFLGLGAGLPDTLRTGLFVWAALILLLLTLGYVLGNSRLTRLQTLALALVVAGGFGNVVDRVFLGTVRDFVSVGFGPLRTGVFNAADVAITTGALLLLWSVARRRPRTEHGR